MLSEMMLSEMKFALGFLLLIFVGTSIKCVPTEIHRILFASSYHTAESEVLLRRDIQSGHGKRAWFTLRVEGHEIKVRWENMDPIGAKLFGFTAPKVGDKIVMHVSEDYEFVTANTYGNAMISLLIRAVVIACFIYIVWSDRNVVKTKRRKLTKRENGRK